MEARLYGRPVVVTCIVSTSVVMIADPETGRRFRADPGDLVVPIMIDGNAVEVPPPKMAPRSRGDVQDAEVLDADDAEGDPYDAFFEQPEFVMGEDVEVLAINDDEWAIAEARLAVITPLLGKPDRSREDADAVAAKAGVNVATVYRWLSDYEGSNDLSSLVRKSPGPAKGRSNLSAEVELIYREKMKIYLHKSRLPVPDIYKAIETTCKANNLPVPAYSTLTRRIARLPKPATLRARGQGDEAQSRFAPAIQTQLSSGPMELVQIDHTEADVILVEEVTREPLGRPWVTFSIDVYSRMLSGLYVSFDRPNAGAVGFALRNAMFEKDAYMAELGVEGDYPVYGPIGIVHADNAKEFRGKVLKRGCQRHNIDLRFRPVKTPRYGAHVERLMGELALVAACMPGKTLNNTRRRKGLQPEKEAALTLREFEAYLVDHFFNKYPYEHHSGIGTSPIHMWEQGVGGRGEAFAPRVAFTPEQKRALAIDLLPYEERTVQPYGIRIGNLTYYDPVLEPFIRNADPRRTGDAEKHIVRYDTRDLSSVIFYDALAAVHHEIPLSTPGVPPFSRWEYMAVRAVQAREGQDRKDQAQFVETLLRLRRRLDDAEALTKEVRERRRLEAVRTAKQARAEKRALLDAPSKPAIAQGPASTAPSAPAAATRFTLSSDPFEDFGDD